MTGDLTAVHQDLPCIEFVELVTDYLDDALHPDLRHRVDEHLAICSGCRTVLAQWHEVIALSGRLDRHEIDQVDPLVRDALVAAFCQAHPAGAP